MKICFACKQVFGCRKRRISAYREAIMKRTLKCDLHTHTKYSYDSEATFREYVEKAVSSGVDVVCFTDHIECRSDLNTFDTFLFAERAEEFDFYRQKYAKQVKLLLGFEVGEPHLHPEAMQFLRSLQPDMIIGSVHFPASYQVPPRSYTDFEYERLYDTFLKDMLQCGGFQVLGHWNMLRKYHKNFVEDKLSVKQMMELCVQNGIVPEVNTTVPRRLGDYSTDMWALRYYAEIGGKYVVVNSDSHRAEDLFCGCAEAAKMLPRQLEQCYFEKGKLVGV